MELESSETKSLLNSLAVKSDEIEWEYVIEQATFLRRREQRWLYRRYRHSKDRQTVKAQGRCRRYDSNKSKNIQAMLQWRSRLSCNDKGGQRCAGGLGFQDTATTTSTGSPNSSFTVEDDEDAHSYDVQLVLEEDDASDDHC